MPEQHTNASQLNVQVVTLLRQLATVGIKLTEAWERMDPNGTMQLPAGNNPFHGGHDFDISEWALQVGALANELEAHS